MLRKCLLGSLVGGLSVAYCRDKQEHFPHVIVGTGTTGRHVLKGIRSKDPVGQVLMISQDPPTQGEELPADANTIIRFDAAVRDLDVDAKALLVGQEGDVVFFDNCVLASGSEPMRVRERDAQGRIHYEWKNTLDVEDIDPKAGDSIRALPAKGAKGGVIECRSKREFDFLIDAAASAERIAVLGDTPQAAALAVRVRKEMGDKGLVTLVTPFAHALSSMLPTALAERTSLELARKGVTLRAESTVHVVDRSTPNAPVTIQLHDKGTDQDEALTADHVVVAVGTKPNVKYAEMAQLEMDKDTGSIVVNSELQARSGLFVAGPAASYYDATLEVRRQEESHDHAVESGYIAGRNAAGARERYAHQPAHAFAVGDLEFCGFGRTESSLQTVSVLDERAQDPSTQSKDLRGVVYYLDDDRIVGVMLINAPLLATDARRILTKKKLYYDKTLMKSLIELRDE